MARIVVGSYMVRYPLGGMMSWMLQYLVGFQRLGHDVYLVESSGYPQSCFDPVRGVMTDDCSYGASVVDGLLDRFGMGDKWCYRDEGGVHHGLSGHAVGEVFRTADLFLDMGTYATWLSEVEGPALRVLLDGEPGSTQMKMANAIADGEPPPRYDRYYTNGMNIGTAESTAPTAGHQWGHLLHPVVCDLFDPRSAPPADGANTTVMNWRSNTPVRYQGAVYGNKDMEFEKFLDLPVRAAVPLEVAVAGPAPVRELEAHGWRVRDGHAVTLSFDAFRDYIRGSRGELGVCKHAFVATNSGWFSDRSGVYLAMARPVVLQETGFSKHLPCGAGLFAVRDAEEAAAALDEIACNYAHHSHAARELAVEHLDARLVLGRFLAELGV